jgi:GDP-4-dehydro-6-deoxy-D-mannose reductase
VVRAYRLILAAPEPPRHPVYLLGSGRSVSIRELVDGLAALARVPVRVVSDPTRRRDGEQPDLYGSAARLAGELGWEARIPLDTTLADTLDWWRGQVAPPGGT